MPMEQRMVGTYEFDCVAEGLVEAFDKFDKMGLDPKVIKWNGPGGGNPQCTITGTPSEVKLAMITIMDVDPEDACADVDANI